MIKTVAIQSLLCMSAVLALSLGMAQATTFSARGNEPSWRLEMTEKAITFRDLDGKTFSIEPVPAPVAADAGPTYSAVVAGEAFTLTVADKGCSDTMTGMPIRRR